MATQQTSASQACDYTDLASALLVLEASRWLGLKEQGGDNKGQLIEQFQKAADGKAFGESWCLSFVQFCIKAVDAQVQILDPLHDKLLAVTNLEHVMTYWMKANIDKLSCEKPHVGSIACWSQQKDGKPTGLGHAGIVTSVGTDGHFETIEGNTHDGLGGIERNGDGVYKRKRSLGSSKDFKLLGFIYPWGIPDDKALTV